MAYGLILLAGSSLAAWPLAVSLSLLGVVSVVAFFLSRVVYNVFFHPLRRYPGPTTWAASLYPYTRSFLSGNIHKTMLDLHATYGPVIRVAPNMLSFSLPTAAVELRGHRKHQEAEHGKDVIAVKIGHIMGANRENHARYRRALSHGFSPATMVEQQVIIHSYVNLLMDRLHQECDSGKRPLDVTQWFNWATFDIIGDLAFGEPFGCLQDSTYHPWVRSIFDGLRELAFNGSLQRYRLPSWAERVVLSLVRPRRVVGKWDDHRDLASSKVRKRMAAHTTRPDFIDAMTRKSGGSQLSFNEIADLSAFLILAGSETTATALSAATFYLTRNPGALRKLQDEVRGTFFSSADITLTSVQQLSYTQAVLDETLRLYPPAPSGQPRVIAEGGDTICGHFVPAGTSVEVWQWSTYRNPDNFSQPHNFIPERWLGDKRFANDKLEAVLPFSVGPRNCIGKNLAYAEMRLILAKLIWAFDLKAAADAHDWEAGSEIFVLWSKPALNMFLTPRKM